jgi:hypothetical protein
LSTRNGLAIDHVQLSRHALHESPVPRCRETGSMMCWYLIKYHGSRENLKLAVQRSGSAGFLHVQSMLSRRLLVQNGVVSRTQLNMSAGR